MRGSLSPTLPSNRSFGFLFTIVFAVLGGYFAWTASPLYPWLLGLCALTLGTTLLAPGALTPLNRAWMKFGEILHRVVSPIVTGIIFFGVVTPTALVIKLIRRDALNRRFDPGRASYWIHREPPGPEAQSFKDQF